MIPGAPKPLTPLQDPAVTRRVLDYTQFMNSKFLFKHLRHEQERYSTVQPGRWVAGGARTRPQRQGTHPRWKPGCWLARRAWRRWSGVGLEVWERV